MEKLLVVIFDDEKKAYEGSRALSALDVEGSISIHSEAVVSKNADGKLSIKEADGDFPIRTLGGTALGSLVGLLGGPIGFGIGAAVGYFAGFLGDLRVAGVDGGFLDDVSKALKPGKFAVVANISEEWVTPLDTRMEALGGEVHRCARSAVELDQIQRQQAALSAELAELKSEHAKAHAERKKKLHSRIDQMETRLQAMLQRDKEQREGLKKEVDAKVRAVQQRAAKAEGDAKAALEKRANELRHEFKIGTAHRAGGSAGGHH